MIKFIIDSYSTEHDFPIVIGLIGSMVFVTTALVSFITWYMDYSVLRMLIATFIMGLIPLMVKGYYDTSR